MSASLRIVDGTAVHTSIAAYSVSCVPDHPMAGDLWEIEVLYTGCAHFGVVKPEDQRWAVVLRDHWVLNRDGKWDPNDLLPGERDDEWIAAHRFDHDTALRLAQELAPGIVINGETAAQAARRLGVTR